MEIVIVELVVWIVVLGQSEISQLAKISVQLEISMLPQKVAAAIKDTNRTRPDAARKQGAK